MQVKPVLSKLKEEFNDRIKTLNREVRDHGKRSRDEVGLPHDAAEAVAHAVLDVENAETVRPDHADAAGACRCGQFFLQCLALVTHFAESGREDDRERDAGGTALLDSVGHIRRGKRDQRDIAWFRHRTDIGIALQSLDSRVLWIHGIDAALVSVFGEQLDRLPTDTRKIVRGADDSDSARVEETGKIVLPAGAGAFQLIQQESLAGL